MRCSRAAPTVSNTGAKPTRIVDLKTGSAAYAGDPATHAQLAMYQAAAAHAAFTGVDHADGAALVFVGGSTKGHSVREQYPSTWRSSAPGSATWCPPCDHPPTWPPPTTCASTVPCAAPAPSKPRGAR
ncbi:PD-(D/E)XK nuclease family protein [Demequina litorisediminis]|uniref:PD-(D/E)XK nuclease family protein n=1 Tax=Demequina litorisediminis TaxID=1849022 RepID=UPI003D666DA9